MRLFVFLGLLLMGGVAEAKIDLVVMDARGIKLNPGDVIDGSQKLTLVEGQQVSLMASDGKVIKLKGPADKPPVSPEAAGTANVQLALQLLVTQESARERAGVIRGAGNLVIPPEPWVIDVSSSGLRCLETGATITLWRPKTDDQQQLVVAPMDRSWRAAADWMAGSDRLSLPSSVPLRKRSTYVVRVGDHETTLTLISLPVTLTNDAMRASYMMEIGCDAQAKALFAKSGLTVQ